MNRWGRAILGAATGGVALLALGASAQSRLLCSYSLQGGWSSYAPSEYITRRARSNDPSGIPQVVSRINGALRIDPNFDVLIAEGEDNAMATTAGGRKVLIIDVEFLERVNSRAGNQWAAISIIAHEVGHHIAGFSPDSHRAELNADYWSGQALMRLGASRRSSTRAIMTFGTEQDSSSHPSKYRRAQTIERGWDDASAGRIDYDFCDDCR